MARSEVKMPNIKVHRGAYQKILENLSNIGENELIITTDKNFPVPTQDSDIGKILRVGNDKELFFDNEINQRVKSGNITFDPNAVINFIANANNKIILTPNTQDNSITFSLGEILASDITVNQTFGEYEVDTTLDEILSVIYTNITSTLPNALEDKANKETTLTANSTTKYPSSKAVADYVNSAVNNVAAYYLTKDSSGNQFQTKAQLTSATKYYFNGSQRTPTLNDWTVVVADESHNNLTARYIYVGGSTNNGWAYVSSYHSSFSLPQYAAINSGITSAYVEKLEGIASGATKVESSTVDGWGFAKRSELGTQYTISVDETTGTLTFTTK